MRAICGGFAKPVVGVDLTRSNGEGKAALWNSESDCARWRSVGWRCSGTMPWCDIKSMLKLQNAVDQLLNEGVGSITLLPPTNVS